jgi:hypothetical protein
MGRVLGALTGAGVIAAALGVAAQQPATPALRDASPTEIWIPHPDISAAQPPAPAPPRGQAAAAADVTPPTAPGNFQAFTSGLFRIAASWSHSVDPESGIDYYAFAIGTGTTTDTEANVRWWQSTGTGTKANVNMALTPGATYYISVRANNGANLSSIVVHSVPLTATAETYGASTNQITYTLATEGISSIGAPAAGWSQAQADALAGFLDKMVPLLTEIYGPPSTSYRVTLIRDLRYTASAIFIPSVEEIHMGDTVTYQLLTHEMVHAFRRDRLLSSGTLWEYDNTLSGFEEGFAQAVSYEAMTAFARRHPSFGLTQKIYQSTHEWDYDFQNVPELGTTDFWSDSSGMNLFWARYEMAAAAIAKISLEHPGFPAAFNAEFYRRITENPLLKVSRALVVDIVATVAPSIEGVAAAAWIDRQYVLDCVNHVGRKIWIRTQHYPYRDYFIFQATHFYETFWNGSDWAVPDGQGGYLYYSLNGSTGAGTLRDHEGTVVWQRPLLLTPTENPPQFYGYGSDRIELTTQPSPEPWPGGDPAKFVTSLLSFGLYKLSVSFTAGTTATKDVYRVIGAPLRDTSGVFGGVIGGNGGTITLHHRSAGETTTVPLVGGAFWTAASWASQDHPETSSNDSTPGVIDVTYVNAAGSRYRDTRTIGYGSSSGTQAFLFDVSTMTLVSHASRPHMAIDSPGAGSSGRTFTVSGWAVDLGAASGAGVDVLHVWAFPRTGGPAQFLGVPAYGQTRGDLGAALGAQFADCGFTLNAPALAPGTYQIAVYAHSSVTGTFNNVLAVETTVVAPVSVPHMALDSPAPGPVGSGPFLISGWALDLGAESGAGIDAIHVWAFPTAGGAPFFVGVGVLNGARPDIGGVLGAQFVYSGYSLSVSNVPPGTYDLRVFAHSVVSGTFNQSLGVRISRD